jgi:hypothetical protein
MRFKINGDKNQVSVEYSFNGPRDIKGEDLINSEVDVFNSVDHLSAYSNFLISVRKSEKARRVKLYRSAAGIAAAVITLAFVIGNLYSNGDKVTIVNKYAVNDAKSVLLITSNGETYSTSGNITVEGDRVVAESSSLISKKTSTNISKINELITPEGVRQKITLPDGSVVWLNAAGSLKFPSEFDDSARVVILSGEAFFDVIKSAKPFIVKIENASVRVYGTTFNISSFKNASVSNISLYTGSIGLRTENSSLMLMPGYYAELDNNNLVISEPQENFSDTPDWMRGRMEFFSKPLNKVFEVISRWYGFDYELLAGAENLEVTIMISDKTSLEELIELLKMTQNISVIHENNKLIISKNR